MVTFDIDGTVDVKPDTGLEADMDVLRSAHEEQKLEEIRRQLDMEFPHFSGPVAVTEEPPAPRRRGRAATALTLLLACASGYAVTVVFTSVYQALAARPAVGGPAPSVEPTPMTPMVTVTRPAATLPPPLRGDTSAEPPSRRRATARPVRPVPDVIRQTATPPTNTTSAASPIAPPIVVSSHVEHVASAAAPITSVPPLKRSPAARPPVVQLASEHVRLAWETVKERAVVRAPGEIAQSPRFGPEAP